MKLKPNHPAAIEGRSIHPKSLKDPVNVLKSVASNKKLGNGSQWITKGKWRGMPMFSLTLEERATCPRTCHHWQDCYGNNMAFAHRFPAGKQLEDRLRVEVAELARIHKNGFVVRLHVLGDFYSREYVNLWDELLFEYPNLKVFGYTARTELDPIGSRIFEMARYYTKSYESRFAIRQSMKDAVIPWSAVETPNEHSITCPEQTGKTQACITCGLCWSVRRPIHFLNH